MSSNMYDLPDTTLKGKGGFFKVKINNENVFGVIENIDSYEGITACYKGIYTQRIVRGLTYKLMYLNDSGFKEFKAGTLHGYSYDNDFSIYSMSSISLNDLISFDLVSGKILSSDEFKKEIENCSETEICETEIEFNGRNGYIKTSNGYKETKKIINGSIFKQELNGLYRVGDTKFFTLSKNAILFETDEGFAIDYSDFNSSNNRYLDYPALFDLGKGLFCYIDSSYSPTFLKVNLEHLEKVYFLNTILNTKFVKKPISDKKFKIKSSLKMDFGNFGKNIAEELFTHYDNNFNSKYVDFYQSSKSRYYITELGVFSNDDRMVQRVVLIDLKEKKYIGWGKLPYEHLGIYSNDTNKSKNLSISEARILVSMIENEEKLKEYISKYFHGFYRDKGYGTEDEKVMNKHVDGFREKAKNLKVENGLILDFLYSQLISNGESKIVPRTDHVLTSVLTKTLREVRYS